MMVCDKAHSQETARPSLQLLNPETDFPFVSVLWPTKSLPNLRKVTLERAESSAKLFEDIDTAFACRCIVQQCIYQPNYSLTFNFYEV